MRFVGLSTDMKLNKFTSVVLLVHYCNGMLFLIVGGTAFSSWVTVRTRSARPTGLQPPAVSYINATVIQLSWDPPQSVNGKLDR